jgi:hypothetical protein
MSEDATYALMKRIDALVNDAAADARLSMDDIERDASYHGRGNSPYSAREKNRALRDIFRKRTTELAGIVSRAARLDATVKLGRLKAGAEQLADRLTGLARNDYLQAGGTSDRKYFEQLARELREQLDTDVHSIEHDFPTGFVWDQPIAAPVPVPPTSQITIGAIHGGNQQIAAGAVVNQKMTVNQAMDNLIGAIEVVRASKDYAALDLIMRRQLDEIADDLIEEARTPAPNASRLHRWGERFMSRLRTAGAWVLEESFKAALIAGMAALAGPGVAQ